MAGAVGARHGGVEGAGPHRVGQSLTDLVGDLKAIAVHRGAKEHVHAADVGAGVPHGADGLRDGTGCRAAPASVDGG